MKIVQTQKVEAPVISYLLRPEIHQEIAKWRNKGVIWDKIAERLSKRLNVSLNSETVRKGWKKAEPRIPANLKDAIKNYVYDMDNYKLIGRWYSVKLMQWSEIAKRFSARIGRDVSSSHLEETWHEASRMEGYPKFERITLKEYVEMPDNFAKIMKWKNEDKLSWDMIAQLMSVNISREVNGSSINRRYLEACEKGLPLVCSMIEAITAPEVMAKIIDWRLYNLNGWGAIARQLQREGIEVTEAVLMSEVPTRYRQALEVERLKKRKGIFAIDGVETNYSDFVNESELHEEIKMWINYAGYNWNDIAERLGRRHGVSLSPERMRSAYKI